MFRHYSRVSHNFNTSFYPTDVAQRYNFPPGDGTGQTVGIIELGGGYDVNDITAYGKLLNLPPVNLTAVSVDGATNVPDQDPNGADGEVNLDIQIVYAVAPKAAIRVYFAPNTDSGFADAIKQAIADKCDVVSISWGGPEDQWSSQTIQEFETLFRQAADAGITVLAAAGDSGFQDDSSISTPTVDYPGSSQWVTSCGGTQIVSNGEVVWNNLSQGDGATGGGMSALFSIPNWQLRDHINKANRCVPDVTANASPLTGYNVIVDGQRTVIGGTSSCSPLYAGLITRVNQLLGRNVGYLNPVLYMMNPRSFYDVVQGNNGYWTAGKNYDLASGLGRLDGTHLLTDIKWALMNDGPTPS